MVENICMQDALTENIPCGVISIGGDGTISYVNNYLCELLAYNKSELEQQPLEKIFPLSTKIFYQTHFYPIIKLHGKSEEISFSLKARDGNSVPVLVNARLINHSIYCVFIPVWQRHKYEAKLLESKKALEETIEKNAELTELQNQLEMQLAESDRQALQLKLFNKEYIEFNQIISHDLHEPIRKLLMQIDLLQHEKSIDKDMLEKFLTKMNTYSKRLRQLAICLQEYVAIDSSAEQISLIDLNEVVNTVVSSLALKETHVSVATNIETLPVIEGCRSQIEELFKQLISNCFKFRKEDHPLQINIRSTIFSDNLYKQIKEKYRYIDVARIEIEDNGIGFPEEYSTYIFGLFKKVHLDKQGTGFGLALCKKIAERHNGSISAKCKNRRTIFSIVLPLQQQIR